jgi:hypothetical protein
MVLAAGCAQQAKVATGSSLSTSGATTTSTSAATEPGPAMGGVHLPAGAEPVPGTQVDAAALPKNSPREVWTEHNGTTLGFEQATGGCFTTKATVTGQTATRVTVRFDQPARTSTGRACPMYIRYQPLYANLTAPLGHRTVVLLMPAK